MNLSPLAMAAAASLAAWIYLALFHGRFWHADQRLDDATPPCDSWPAVAV